MQIFKSKTLLEHFTCSIYRWVVKYIDGNVYVYIYTVYLYNMKSYLYKPTYIIFKLILFKLPSYGYI